MGTHKDPTDVAVVVATRLEAWAARRALSGERVIEGGVGLRRLPRKEFGRAVVTCGLAGAVRPGLRTGTIVIPERVLRPDGDWLSCDPLLVASLVAAAGELGLEPERGPLGTASAFVRGAARMTWAERGCVAVDMETGLLTAPRIAAVRVVLDSPERDLSEVWRRPALVLAHPEVWREALWLSREAPRCAWRAAAVLAAALRSCRRQRPAVDAVVGRSG